MAVVAGRQAAGAGSAGRYGHDRGRGARCGRRRWVVVYARVSSGDRRAGLDRQVARVTGQVAGRGLTVAGVVRAVGSGLAGRRPQLRRILSDPCAMVIVVEHRGRLARFGVEQLDAALAARGRHLVVAGPGKSTWYGSRLVVAGRWHPSSKTCSACGAVKAKLALAERNWT